MGGCLKACTPFVKVENGHLTIKFDEISMLLFGHNVPGILLDTRVENFSFKVLVCPGLTEIFWIQHLLQPVHPLEVEPANNAPIDT